MNYNENNCELKLSAIKIIILSLFPGLMVILVAFILLNPLFGINLPLLLVGIIVMTGIGNIPAELVILKIIAWKENKKIKDIIIYKNKTPRITFVLSAIITFIFAGLVFVLLEQFESKLWNYLKIFDFIPDWFRMDKIDLQDYKNMKIIVVLYYILNGFFAPFIEEIYFRGYLLPRMNIFGKFAPLINALLFSVYHFFSPWQIITRIIAMTPMTYLVWKNKDVKIGILSHCLLNIVGGIGMLMILF